MEGEVGKKEVKMRWGKSPKEDTVFVLWRQLNENREKKKN